MNAAPALSEKKSTKTHAMVGWVVHIAALLTGLMGFANLASAVTPRLASRLALLRRFSPLEVRHGSLLTSVLAGFALLLLAESLERRKRVAWLLTLVILLVSAITHLFKGLDYELSLLALTLAVWLYTQRAHFHAHSDQPSISQGLKTLVAALAFTLAYGVGGFYFFARHFSVHFGLRQAFEQTVIMFTQFYDPGLQPIPLTRFGRFFADSIYVVGAVTLGYAFFMLVRPVLIRQPASPGERERAADDVQRYGCSSLARLALLEDKSYYFSPGGSLVPFVVKGRVALTLGDPIGPPNDIPTAIYAFKAHCIENDWAPAFYQVTSEYLKTYQQLGFTSLCIGHEAVVDLSQFTLEGKTGKPLRGPVNRLTRLGYTAVPYDPPLPDAFIEELRQVSDAWLTMVHGSEKRFSVGWFDTDYVRGSQVIAVQTPEGRVAAFANLLPEYQRSEVALDMMRRMDKENGMMEFLFVSMFEWARAHGYASFDLGLSALAGVGEHSTDPAVEKALHYIYEHVNQFYNFKGLHEFKEKFQPHWSPRYLVFPNPASLPAVAMALIRADSGDDFFWEYLKK